MSVETPGTSCRSPSERVLELRVLQTLGIHLPKEARILDFGCGAGRTIQALRRLGYVNTEGYDVTDGRTLLRTDPEHIKTGTLLNLTLPYEDASFDLIISDQVFEHVQDQVRTFAELYRITKAGGHGLHIFPARYAPLEGHIFVPFGGVFQHRWYYKFWAAMGIRNEYQKGMTADQTADHNAQFAVDATRYIPASCYRAVWKDIGFEQRFSEQQFFDGHERPSMRLIGKGGGLTAWLYRTFRSRVVYLHKP